MTTVIWRVRIPLQLLTPAQRASLNEAVTALRKSLGIWVAERLEALTPQDLLAVGVKSGRDYTADIRLEDFWRNRQGPLKRFLEEIADLRVDQADGFQGRTFFSLLAPQLLDVEWRKKFEAYALRLETELAGTNTSSARYSDWIETTRRADEEGLGRAIAWRRLGIMIERDRGKDQPSFDFEMLPAERLTGSTTAQISEAAELMVVRELQAPFYYGPDRIAQLSSANVDQFLALSGDLFEEILSAKLLRRPELQLSAVRQHALVKAAAKRLWRDIPRGSARGHAVLRFLEALAHVCVNETHRATAPYAPGVTGIGITMNDRDMLAEGGGSAHAFAELREVIATCVAHNLLEPKLDLMNKGQRWLVLYLNRMLCAHHDLPLGYGGWRPQKLPALAKWIAAGSASVQEDKLV